MTACHERFLGASTTMIAPSFAVKPHLRCFPWNDHPDRRSPTGVPVHFPATPASSSPIDTARVRPVQRIAPATTVQRLSLDSFSIPPYNPPVGSRRSSLALPVAPARRFSYVLPLISQCAPLVESRARKASEAQPPRASAYPRPRMSGNPPVSRARRCRRCESPSGGVGLDVRRRARRDGGRGARAGRGPAAPGVARLWRCLPPHPAPAGRAGGSVRSPAGVRLGVAGRRCLRRGRGARAAQRPRGPSAEPRRGDRRGARVAAA